MPEFAWTPEKPTEPGDYVYRKSRNDCGELLHIHVDRAGLYRIAAGLRHVPQEEWPDGHYLGPLPEVTDG